MGWSCIGLGALAQCLLCGVFSFAGMPGSDAGPSVQAHRTPAAHTAKVVMTAGAGVGLIGMAFGVSLLVCERPDRRSEPDRE